MIAKINALLTTKIVETSKATIRKEIHNGIKIAHSNRRENKVLSVPDKCPQCQK